MRLGDLDKLKENFIKWLPKEGEDFLSDIHPIENIVISAIMEIEEAPTINPEDLRPKGKWIEKQCQTYLPVEYDDFGEPILHNFVVYHCDQCGRMERKKEPYCNCGAKMEV